MFPGGQWPPFLSGSGYLMHRSTARLLLSAAPSEPLLHLEDVYVTGLLARRAGVRPVNNDGFWCSANRRSYPLLPSYPWCPVTTGDSIRPEEMLAIYGRIQADREANNQTRGNSVFPQKLN